MITELDRRRYHFDAGRRIGKDKMFIREFVGFLRYGPNLKSWATNALHAMTIQILSLRSSGNMSPKDQESLATTPHQALASQLRYGLANGQPIVTPGNPRYNYARSITTMSLYSDKGLDIYEEITKLEEYYPFQAELEILKEHGEDIVSWVITPSSAEVELMGQPLFSDRLNKARRMMGERGPDSDNEVPIVDEERDSPEYEEGKGVVQSNQRWYVLILRSHYSIVFSTSNLHHSLLRLLTNIRFTRM